MTHTTRNIICPKCRGAWLNQTTDPTIFYCPDCRTYFKVEECPSCPSKTTRIYELKEEAIQLWREHHFTTRKIGNILSVPRETVKRWLWQERIKKGEALH